MIQNPATPFPSFMLSLSSIVFVILVLLSSCSVAPSDDLVRDKIVRHFDARGYRVVRLDLVGVTSQPLGEREYMSPREYEAVIRLITLEVSAPEAGARQYEKGGPLTFRDARISLARQKGSDGEWIITNISGIAIP